MKDKILMKFAKKGINLSPEGYNLILKSENPINLTSSIIVKLKSSDFKSKELISVSAKTIKSLIDKDFKSEKSKKEEISLKKNETENKLKTKKLPSEKIVNEEINYERNKNKTKVEYDFEIIQDSSKKSYTNGEIEDMVSYFKSRYDKLSKILLKRPELKMKQKINEIEDGQKDVNLIVMVKEIRTTKKGHKLIEFEDETGTAPILFSNKDEELFNESEKLIRDEVVGIIGEKSDNDLIFGKQIINPGVQRIERKKMDFGIVFLSDIHIGSLNFLEENFNKFIEWINCKYGSEKQREIAEDIKYLLIDGDIVDGIGVYPNQEKDLAIKDITTQYNEAAKILGRIRSDIKIIIAPGNHDASRIAEPQPAIPEEYAKSLYNLDNVEFVSNPAVISCDGIKILMYHGESFLEFQQGSNKFNQLENEYIMEEMLQKRHLAPVYGEKTPLASELEDYLVIDETPDILHTGHVHVNRYKHFNGIHLINSGTWQTQTDFQKIKNIEPTPAQVSIIHKGLYKQLDFSKVN